MSEWRLTRKEAGRHVYRAPHGVVFQVATGGWMALHDSTPLRAPWCDAFRHTARALRFGVTPGAFRTADLAMRAVDGARDAAKAREYIAQRDSRFAADKEAGRKAGAEFFAHVNSHDRASLAARSLRADVQSGAAGYQAAKAHCGVFAPPARHRAFAEAFREAFYVADKESAANKESGQ